MARPNPYNNPVHGLKCLFCVDKHLDSADAPEPADAITLVPYAQTITVAGQTVIGVTAVPCCEPCRAGQIGSPASNGRLLVA